MEIIEKYIEIDEIYKRETYILEKSKPTECKDNIYKDGVHIYFPNIIVKSNIKYLIRNEFIEETKKNPIFNDTINDISDIIDESVIERNGMLLYGSKKPDQKHKYKLTSKDM
jgi:hypothetical protein